MRRITATLLLVGALVGIIGGVQAQPADTHQKPNGVTVIANDALGAPGLSSQAVGYAAHLAGK